MAIEMVDLVNDADEIVKTVTRAEMRAQHEYMHRATYVVVKNPAGGIWVQRRTMTKDYCPGMLDACTGGVVTTGEDPDIAAIREVEEEIGIKNADLKKIGKHLLGGRVFAHIFVMESSGPFVLQESEVVEMLLMDANDIVARAGEFTPDSVTAMKIALGLV